jgi:glycogen phosphorylase
VLTVGFARRFATYKRATLLLSQPDRLKALLLSPDRPIQLVFAGKAHPADRPGQKVIQEIFQRSRSPQLRGRVFVLENYDMRVGRYLVQGVDTWLNNPRRPLEASGTSGMKAAMNGVLHLSILDGWWPEGCEHGVTGWAIGDSVDGHDQDGRDLHALYDTLEGEVMPAFADPGRWTRMMRASIEMATTRFSADRMVRDYFALLYSRALAPPRPTVAGPA